MVEEGTGSPSFVREALMHESFGYNGDDEQAMCLAMSAISAGSDDTRTILNTLVMATLCYPEAVQKARDEADAVCGGKAERLTLISDIDVMPYTCALVKEVRRWRPIVPVVPPHQLTEDLEFEGYRLPKETEFLINTSLACNTVEEPGSFIPERWLNGNESSIGAGLWVFGGGRRMCVGYKLAQTQLFVAFSRLTYCFDYAAVSSLYQHDLMSTDFSCNRLVNMTA